MYSIKKHRYVFSNIKILTQHFLLSPSQQNISSTVEGLVLGVYDNPDGTQSFTEAGERFNENTNGLASALLERNRIEQGKARVYSHIENINFTHITLTGLGPKKPNPLNLTEQLNEEKENIRVAMAAGARACQDEGATHIKVDGATIPESAAEGSILGTYKYNANHSSPPIPPHIELYDKDLDMNSWLSGEINAESQNWARHLSHMPSNLKKPEMLSTTIIEKLCKFDVTVEVHNKDWMAQKNMNASLFLTRGTCEPPLLLEISYCGDDPHARPIALVGKCNICDTGGLYLKPYKGMHEFRADMAGAAAICATFMAVARKRIPINLRAVLLIYENIPSPMGMKPGDVIRNKEGTYIRISNPDNDCRVVLTDIVHFTDLYAPILIIDVGTFTKSVADMFGFAASGVFTTNTKLYNEILRAGLESGDRVWRLPLWQHYADINRSNPAVDLDNGFSSGDTCLAAAFMKEFLPYDYANYPQKVLYIHIDCFGTALLSQTRDELEPYYRKGIKMGRPTRLLIQFLLHRACFLPRPKNAMIVT